MGGIGVSESGANIIFIEKRKSFPPNLRRRQAKVPDSCWHERKALWRPPVIERETRDEGGLQPTRSLGRTNNVFLTKMYDLLPDKRTKRFDRLNCYEVSIMGGGFLLNCVAILHTIYYNKVVQITLICIRGFIRGLQHDRGTTCK